MTPADREKAFQREVRARLRAQVALLNDTEAEVQRLMRAAIARVNAILAAQPSDYQRWSLPQIRSEIQRALEVFRAQGAAAVSAAQQKSWDGGKDFIDRPLEAGGVRIAGVMPLITQDQLAALKSFLADRIRDVTAEAVNRINAQLGLVTIGAQTPFEATKSVASILGEESLGRATAIVRTEIGRAFSVASQARMAVAAKAGVAMDKVWRRSGKPHQRPGHAAADGQRVAYDKPFEIISKHGEILKLMYPRDPKAPPEETINCGCVMIPKVRGWESSTPDRAPFTERELATNPDLRKLFGIRPSA